MFPDRWTHAAITYSDSTLKLYVDSYLVHSVYKNGTGAPRFNATHGFSLGGVQPIVRFVFFFILFILKRLHQMAFLSFFRAYLKYYVGLKFFL